MYFGIDYAYRCAVVAEGDVKRLLRWARAFRRFNAQTSEYKFLDEQSGASGGRTEVTSRTHFVNSKAAFCVTHIIVSGKTRHRVHFCLSQLMPMLPRVESITWIFTQDGCV